MIVRPGTAEEHIRLATVLQHFAHVSPSFDQELFGWVTDNEIRMVVGFNGFMGRVAQIHVAMADEYTYTPREMLEEVFHHAFGDRRLHKLIGIVNSRNEAAMRFDKHLGFVEEHRLPGMHDGGGDIVIMSMTPEQCRYWKERMNGKGHSRIAA